MVMQSIYHLQQYYTSGQWSETELYHPVLPVDAVLLHSTSTQMNNLNFTGMSLLLFFFILSWMDR